MLEKEYEWPIGADGLPTRDAARVILIDEAERVLLVRGHDANDSDHSWWFTVGGGLEAGESHREAAVRECLEETGIRLNTAELEGPVICRDAKMFFADRTRRQIEQFFIARVDAVKLDYSRWSNDERRLLDEMRWFEVEELLELREEASIFPRQLPDLLVKWRDNEGTQSCVKIDEYNET
ncbi:NUDIX hydrolase [Gleimia europaea]|uniref:Nudix hydrolase domain-containing protein n=1 Tax=Gleimia europaea ACS-120-V-Col10b TaxID=883069 RepID=A0A9W5VW15_9ACTO|nr:NUDIX domain-containing protein [Gleimia europaea]EPD30424.1 hypothetical protein HMPREF9238_00167 [Gleimia europaea ACS-120-V-Col10b]